VLAGRYLDGDGIRQNAATAARMYSTICNGREYVKAATEASCAKLGVLYAKGDRVPLKFREGVALLTRACKMGDDYGCQMRDIYGGTGKMAESVAPDGTLGFSFGWSNKEAKVACENGHGEWTDERALLSKDAYYCNTHLDAIDRDGSVHLTFIDHKLAEISVFYELTSSAVALKEFSRVGDLLEKIYGLPSQRVFEVQDECRTRSLDECIVKKQAEFSMQWVFESNYSVGCSVESHGATGPLFLMLMYGSPASMTSGGHQGL
jgi:hypothetical protein